MDLRVVQLLLGHTRLQSTVRYLGIEVDDALEFFEQILSKLAGKQCAMLVFHAGYLRVEEFLSVEADSFNDN